jgi:predicted AlkP superfamily phosphohydrolase/phosphomutase
MARKTYFSDETKDVVSFLFDCNGKFSHYEYFTKELWRKVKGRKKEDRGEVHAMFLHLWLRQMYGTFSIPCGMAWYSYMDEREYPYDNGCAERLFNEYIDDWKDIIDDYNKWVVKQR